MHQLYPIGGVWLWGIDVMALEPLFWDAITFWYKHMW